MTYNFDPYKTVHSILFILNKLGEVDYHKLFKILYFADQSHLKDYGRPIIGDRYIAMPYGPVPSFTYDVLKAVQKEGNEVLASLGKGYFDVKKEGTVVKPIAQPDLEELSESEIEALEKSIEDNKDLNFQQLKDKSHDNAWKTTTTNSTMSFVDIAQAAGASKEIIEYMEFVSENLANQH